MTWEAFNVHIVFLPGLSFFYSRAAASLRLLWVGIAVVQTIVSLVIVALLVMHI